MSFVSLSPRAAPELGSCLGCVIACVTLPTSLRVRRADGDSGRPKESYPQLPPNFRGHWAVWVDENFRLTFRFEGKDVVQVDYRDYH